MRNSTIDYYNKNAQTYFSNTVRLDVHQLYQPFLKHLHAGAKILDACCGSGRDSFFFKSKGFKVTAFDASEEMIKLSSKLLEQDVLLMHFEDLNLTEQYNGIWACASLIHVQRSELVPAIARIAKHLKPGGIFYMSFKYGNKEYWKDGRYFNCLDEETFKSLIEQIPELKVDQVFISADVMDRTNERWLNAYLVKA